MKLQTKTLLTAFTACAALVAGSADNTASADIVVFDPVPTSASNPFVSAALDSGVTVTGSGVQTDVPANVDPNTSSWNGNGYTYRPTSGSSPGSVTYAAATGDYFTDFSAQIIVNRGQIGDSLANALARFTFASSTDGTIFVPFTVAGSGDSANGGDWQRYNITTTALDSLTDITHLKITITPKASGGATWHQQLGSVSMEVVPEPGSLALLGLGGLLIARRRRD